ncbi:N-glycosylase/DNA lyase [Candidatus Woesearchaeota archaeon]|nr:N-glycosylase/DNA lyase [Candidatus Woesearchaeota archaeon]
MHRKIKSQGVGMINDIKRDYEEKKDIIKDRLNDFKQDRNDEELFYELCFCLLTPQSSAKAADKCIKNLKERDFYNAEAFNPAKLIVNVRFNNNKAKYLMEAKEKFPLIKKKLNEIKNNEELRLWLVKNVKGLGLKESSHFLRNIGYRGLAILDRHILKNLHKSNVINELPKTLTPKVYFEIEKKFKDFSREVSIDMDELDLLFWSMETGEVFK